MIPQPPRSTRTDTLFPYTSLFRSAVLHLACGIAFGVDIADFLELERAFKCYWIVGPTAEIQHVACHHDLGGDCLDRVLISKGGIERGGRFSQMLDDGMQIGRAHV